MLAAMTAILMSCESSSSSDDEEIDSDDIERIYISSFHVCEKQGSSDGQEYYLGNEFEFTKENSEITARKSGDYIHVSAEGSDRDSHEAQAAQVEFDIDTSSKKVKNLEFAVVRILEGQMSMAGVTVYSETEINHQISYGDIPLTSNKSDYKEAQLRGSDGLEINEYYYNSVTTATYSDPSIHQEPLTEYYKPFGSGNDMIYLTISSD